MIPIKDTLRQETKCYGILNGKTFELNGGGLGSGPIKCLQRA
jgi:hypothetical protein